MTVIVTTNTMIMVIGMVLFMVIALWLSLLWGPWARFEYYVGMYTSAWQDDLLVLHCMIEGKGSCFVCQQAKIAALYDGRQRLPQC